MLGRTSSPVDSVRPAGLSPGRALALHRGYAITAVRGVLPVSIRPVVRRGLQEGEQALQVGEILPVAGGDILCRSAVVLQPAAPGRPDGDQIGTVGRVPFHAAHIDSYGAALRYRPTEGNGASAHQAPDASDPRSRGQSRELAEQLTRKTAGSAHVLAESADRAYNGLNSCETDASSNGSIAH